MRIAVTDYMEFAKSTGQQFWRASAARLYERISISAHGALDHSIGGFKSCNSHENTPSTSNKISDTFGESQVAYSGNIIETLRKTPRRPLQFYKGQNTVVLKEYT